MMKKMKLLIRLVIYYLQNFKIEETSGGRDRLKITGPSGEEHIVQVDLSQGDEGDQRLAAIEIYDLKQFIKSEQYSTTNPNGWKWKTWSNRINNVSEAYKELIETPYNPKSPNNGGIGLTLEQDENIIKYASDFTLGRGAGVGVGGYL